MDSDGGFHEVEEDNKLIQFVYHHPKYNPIPQIQISTSSNETANHDHPKHKSQTKSLKLTVEVDSIDHSPKPFFLCPIPRLQKHPSYFLGLSFPLKIYPEYISSTTRTQQDHPFKVDDHHVLPLFWCNNKEFDPDVRCFICGVFDIRADYYFCVSCDGMFHKECVESPLKIKHPCDHDHSLQLYFIYDSNITLECLSCGLGLEGLLYYCNTCQIAMHLVCAMKPIPLVIDQPKRHYHPLTLFPRQTSLVCDVCGLLRKNRVTYVCFRSNFVAHNDCMCSPNINKISRHHHRVSYVSSLKPGEWHCGVCRQRMDCRYGAYICDKCGEYAVHSRCALRKDICDGKELEGVPEEDITQDVAPFVTISEGVILHFLHDHHLRLKAYTSYDEDKLCQACVMPIFEGNLYTCMECDFIFHERCAEARRRIQHALHPHLLTLKVSAGYSTGLFGCDACGYSCGGFTYQCLIKECEFDLDLRCASISEPFGFQGHEHPLFLSLDPGEKPICDVCRSKCKKQLDCIECGFLVCFKCATLPYNARYRHDKHFLTLLWGEEVCEKDWCEVCERNLGDTNTKLFYWCKDCCTTLHIGCLFGGDPYLKPGQITNLKGNEVQILRKSNVSRSLFCNSCRNPCQRKFLKMSYLILCSWKCALHALNL